MKVSLFDSTLSADDNSIGQRMLWHFPTKSFDFDNIPTWFKKVTISDIWFNRLTHFDSIITWLNKVSIFDSIPPDSRKQQSDCILTCFNKVAILESVPTWFKKWQPATTSHSDSTDWQFLHSVLPSRDHLSIAGNWLAIWTIKPVLIYHIWEESEQSLETVTSWYRWHFDIRLIDDSKLNLYK